MKKFQFSLDHVRDYRDRLLDEETGKLQRLRAEQTRIEQLIAQLEADFAQVSQAMRDGLPLWSSGGSACNWKASGCRLMN